ncbi:MAG TPA: tetratricopeptide repeat protein [Chthoniobacterales bacterium]|nr:tetratricopeptide repeat protein [Chthoniobacterales bacterium]
MMEDAAERKLHACAGSSPSGVKIGLAACATLPGGMRALLALLFLFAAAAHNIRAAGESERLHEEGEAALRAGDYETAIARYSEVIKANPRDTFAYNSRAIAYRQGKEYEKALADLAEAIRLKPGWMFSYNRAVTYYEAGDAKAAVADLTQALKQSPPKGQPRADCLMLRARCYFEEEEVDLALADVNAAIKAEVEDAEPYVLRGILHKVRHKYRESLADYEKAIAINPTNGRAYDLAAYLLSVCPVPKYRDAKRAIEYAQKACELTRWEDASPIETLAAAYAEARQFEQAIELQNKAAALDPKRVDSERVALYEQRQPFRDLNHSGKAAASAPAGGVSIEIGESRKIRFEVDGAQLVNPTASTAADDRHSLTLEFRRNKADRVLFLQHSFDETIRVKCMARLQGQDAYFETDLLPVPPNTINPEVWSEEIEELVLFDFHIADNASQEQRISQR